MEAEKVVIKVVGTNNGFNVKNNGIVEQKISVSGEYVAKVLSLLQIAGRVMGVAAKLETGDVVKLGKFNFHYMKIDRDAEVALVLRSDVETVDAAAGAGLPVNELITFSFVGASAGRADDK